MSGDGGGSGPLRANYRVVWVHRIGAVVVAVIIAVFGVLGFVGGLSFFDTQGAPIAGLSTNGALSTVSVVTAVVLIAAAIRGGRLSSTVMIVVGTLFLVSAFVNLWLIGTPYNLLAFRLPNVFFSIGAGLVLLFTGAYGRISAKLPSDNPYKQERRPHDPEDHGDAAEAPQDSHRQPRPSSPAEADADLAMAQAERALVQGAATEDQRRRLAAVERARTHEERREIWMGFDRSEERTDRRPGDRGTTMA